MFYEPVKCAVFPQTPAHDSFRAQIGQHHHSVDPGTSYPVSLWGIADLYPAAPVA